MKSINESLIYRGKFNILRFLQVISTEDIYSAFCLLVRKELQNGVIASPVKVQLYQEYCKFKMARKFDGTRIPMFSRPSKE